MHDALRSLRLTVRALGRSPGFTLAAVAALALGIGGSTVVFSVVDTLLLRSLPYGDADRLVIARPTPPWALYEQWRTATSVFEGMAAYNERAANVSGAGEPERVMMARVTPTFFSVVRIRPVIGRDFNPDEVRSGQTQVVLLTDAFWRRHFNASPAVVGQTLTLDDRPYTILGVLPPHFKTPRQLAPARGLSFDAGAAVVVPIVSDPLRMREPNSTDAMWRGMEVIGRLRPGVALQRAQSVVATLARGVTLPWYFKKDYTVVRIADYVAGDLPGQLAILAAAVALLLLVACANVANLLLARGTGLQREMATRVAVGATTRQLVAHALGETLVIGLAGGLAGTALAWAGTKTVAVAGGAVLARLDAVSIDPRVLGFTLAVSLGVGVLVGIVPALKLARSAPAALLRVTRGYAPGATGRIALASILVVFEVTLSLVLVVGATLLARDLTRTLSRDLGFRSEGVLTADVSLSRLQYRGDAQQTAFFQELVVQAAALPGVATAAAATLAPGSSAVLSVPARVEGATGGTPSSGDGALGPEKAEFAQMVGGDFFRALAVPVLEGRPFTPGDTASAERVAVANAAFARKYWGGARQAIGRRVKVDEDFYRIVGVVGDMQNVASRDPALTQLYFTLPQAPFNAGQMTLILRAARDPASLAAPLHALVRRLNPNQPLYNVLTLDRIVSTQFARQRFIASLMVVFAVITLLLAGVGVYSVMSYAVAQDTHELGVRIALGSSCGDVFGLVLARGLRLLGAGMVIGLPAAFGASRLLSSRLVAVTYADLGSYVATALLVTALGLAACAVPAWRATRVDPVVSLRGE